MSLKPFLRWAGSKRKLIPKLERYWDGSADRYVEPFAGSACLYFHLNPERALLSDINTELVLAYKSIKSDYEAVFEALNRLPTGKDGYYTVRSSEKESMCDIDVAARFIYLNRYCFNGLYRTNRKGIFNVPYGGEKSGSLPTLKELSRYSAFLSNTEIENCDFRDILHKVRSGDFVYMDPPFSVRARRVFNEYDASVFSESDLSDLRNWMLKLDDNGISFVVSYAECDEASSLAEGFSYDVVSVRRNISGFAKNRKIVNEIMIYN
ncbi:DNA adenine methylase [Rubrivirga sp.]|uniref:DNA adenine methylase n=1 Tax=Rubrivirga sp. TaxID=1885344 RepID=UPI003B521EA8